MDDMILEYGHRSHGTFGLPSRDFKGSAKGSQRG